ncbi:TadE/TadG family type IV pilus assembly protein [Ovoidimarina sediminis]|uniref:TadE/TadG family type IV pilus assembly protein n=1 Tax=Ovoidimarina sediminis TaxID=3079856 RepID=UPI00290EE6F0|nr:TadE/TadG family type IV pilus assembly protein [Rhodophyticola sp. MJ-SS7]MDU8946028.1 TadE/TadG family type IV pilus assembly protein [Rhodophyticola sp. MJ-SS7]
MMRLSPTYLSRLAARFRREDDGAALVELAILLPVFLMLFAMIIEGGRMMWSYQAVIAGVRDTSRYVARVAPRDLCITGGSIPASVVSSADTMVKQTVQAQRLFPNGITVGTVTVSYTCSADNSYRGGEAPIAEVTAPLTIRFPFAGIFRFAGGDLSTINTTVTDRSRIYGI